ncbi:MAG TPA: hypothetical protein VMZ52_05810 [Bryobacteraceae bacterium]|nr:hypothetical protein [Bryobacteraceae bacterium]
MWNNLRHFRTTLTQEFSKHRQWAGLILLLVLPFEGVSDIQTTTQTMTADISPYGKLSVPSNVTLRSSSTGFGGDFTGNLTISYWARTSVAGGGTITVQAGSEFSPAGGPSISSVTYLCSGATLGAACSGSQTLATATQTPIVTLPSGACTGGGGPCSTQEPNTVQLSVTSPDKPQYKTGTYSALITFTISTL